MKQSFTLGSVNGTAVFSSFLFLNEEGHDGKDGVGSPKESSEEIDISGS